MITEIFERVRWVTGALAVNEVEPETNGVKTHVVDTFLSDEKLELSDVNFKQYYGACFKIDLPLKEQ